MLDKQLFEFAEVTCADDYIMAREERTWQEALLYIENNKCRIDTLIFKPKTNQIRFMFLPSRANNNKTEVFNINNPPIQFLRKLWELDVTSLQSAMTKFMVQGYKDTYDNLEVDDKTWLTAAVLGGRDD